MDRQLLEHLPRSEMEPVGVSRWLTRTERAAHSLRCGSGFASLARQKLQNSLMELNGFLSLRPVPAVLENAQSGIGDQLVSLCRPFYGYHSVLRSMDDQCGLGDFRQPVQNAISKAGPIHFILEIGSPGSSCTPSSSVSCNLVDQIIGDHFQVMNNLSQAEFHGLAIPHFPYFFV